MPKRKSHPSPVKVGRARVTVRPERGQDAAGRWEWRALVTEADADGRKKRRSVWSGRAHEAEVPALVLAALEQDTARVLSKARRARVTTVKDLLEVWLGEQRKRQGRGAISPKSYDAYQCSARHMRDLYPVHLRALTTQRLRQWLRSVDYAPRTKAQALSRLGTAWNFGREVLPDLPRAPRFPDVHVPKEIHYIPTEGEVAQCLAWVKEHRHPDVGAALELQALTGMRVGEVACLTWRQADAKRRTPCFLEMDRGEVVIQWKRKRRRIALPVDAHTLLRSRPQEEARVFPHYAERSLVSQVNLGLRAAQKSLDLPPWSSHGVRRWFEGVLFRTPGLALSKIAGHMGHTLQVAERHYVEMTGGDSADAITAAGIALPRVPEGDVVAFRGKWG